MVHNIDDTPEFALTKLASDASDFEWAKYRSGCEKSRAAEAAEH